MADFGGFVRKAARKAGRTVGQITHQVSAGQIEGSLPQDESGKAHIVCRRYAEKRAVSVSAGKPTCFTPDNPDCESCVEDIADGTVETW